MSKTVKRSIVLALIVVMIVSACAVFAGCKVLSDDYLDSTPVSVNMQNDFYVGNSTGSYNLADKFGAVEMSMVDNGIATLSGTTLTFKGVGKVEIIVGGVAKNVYVIDGVNVTDEAALRATLDSAKNVVMQGDIRFAENGNNMALRASIYGNGYTMYLRELIKPILKKSGAIKSFGPTAFSIESNSNITNKIELNGIKMNGKEFEPNVTVGLESMEGQGAFVSMSGTDTFTPEVSAYNCVFENGHKMFFFDSSILNVEACIFKNASDNVLCLETRNTKGAVLNIENSTIVNSLDAAILFCGWTKTDSADDFCSLNITGFLDIYNWKSTKTAKLMPNTENFADLVNNMVQKEMKKKNYQKFLFKEGFETYLHSGIIAIATGDLKKNTPTINGTVMDQDNIVKETGVWDANDNAKLKEINYQLRGFPIPDFAKIIAKTCIIIGYGNTDAAKDAYIKPSTKFSKNVAKLIETELRGGRVTA